MSVRACLVRCLSAIMPVLLLGACAQRDPAVTISDTTNLGNWLIERQVNRATGTAISSARVATRSSSNSAVVFAQLAGLQLTCFKRQPIVRFTFLFKVGANRNTELSYRFDGKPGHQADARILRDNKIVVIEDRAAVAQFVNDLATSQVLYVFIRSLNGPRSSAEFEVGGAPAAIEAGLADCPLTGQPRPRAASMPSSRPPT